MKINWGTGIVIAFGLFMLFILSFVYKVQSNQKYDNELVTEEYYKKEQNVDAEYSKQTNANALIQKVAITSNENGISIQFPSDFDSSKIKGKVSLYRPSSQKLDFEVPISLSDSNLLIPKSDLVSGLWDISVDWSYEGKDYLNKETIHY